MFELRDRAEKQQAPVGDWNIGVVEPRVVKSREADDETVKNAFSCFLKKVKEKKVSFFHVKVSFFM